MYLSEEMLRDIRIGYTQVGGMPTLSVFVARKHTEASRDRLASPTANAPEQAQ
jgi:hypothetical protein